MLHGRLYAACFGHNPNIACSRYGLIEVTISVKKHVTHTTQFSSHLAD
jgi:hypothetical protein